MSIKYPYEQSKIFRNNMIFLFVLYECIPSVDETGSEEDGKAQCKPLPISINNEFHNINEILRTLILSQILEN